MGLARGARRVDRRGHGSDVREREVEQHPFDPRPGEDPERVALLQSEGEQSVRELVDRLRRFAPRHFAPGAVRILDEVGRSRAPLGNGFLPERPDRAHRVYFIPLQPGRKRRVQVQFVVPMRTIWNGSISFGLVNIPVGMALATKAVARQSDVSFRPLHRECGTPIKNKRWCPEHDREVSNDEIVKGWEVAKGQFVIVEDADLEALSTADDSRTIAITRFVELDQVDPIYFDRTYFLAPADAAAQRRPYVLLLEAMKETNTAAVGKFVRQGAEHFCLIRPKGNALALETLFLAEDVRSQAEIEEAVEE